MSTVLQRFARSEIATHADEKSLWIILDNKVYDVTKVCISFGIIGILGVLIHCTTTFAPFQNRKHLQICKTIVRVVRISFVFYFVILIRSFIPNIDPDKTFYALTDCI